jgi:sugar phosphate isomerase/epimerase
MAQDQGLALGLENHFGLTSHPEDILAILELAGQDENLGVCLDLDNVCAGQDALAMVRTLAPHAVHVHYKARDMDPQAEARRLGYEERLAALARAGYKGAFAVEYLGPGDGIAQAQAAARALQGLWGEKSLG